MDLPSEVSELDGAWLEDALRRDAGLAGARVRNVASEIIGVGFGLDGTLARLTIDGDGAPATLVAKWCKAKPGAAETRFYREVAPQLDLALARLFASWIDEPEDRALLVLSDVAPAKQGDVLVGATREEMEALVDAMAALHARFWGADLAAAFPWLGDCPADRDGACRVTRERLPRFLADWRDRVPPAAIEAWRDLPDRLAAAHDRLAAAPQTVVHTDLHLDNVLFTPDGRAVVLDWTDVRRGPAAMDFARQSVENLSAEGRRAFGDGLAERYLRALAARGVRDYDAERFRLDCDAAATVCFAAIVRWAAGPDSLGPDVPRVPAIVDMLIRRAGAVAADGVTSR